MIDAIRLGNLIVKKASGDSNKATQLYQMFFFEHILERISKSKYNSQIILKGGLLLASVVGDDHRVTKDMDATIKGFPLQKETVYKIMSEILSIDVNDNISFELLSIKDMRDNDIYGGFQFKILGKLSNLKNTLTLELTTGDPITPREMEYQYNCIFEDKKIPIFAYTLETVIAEKFHAFVSKGIRNTRMKDFYDLYTLIDNSDANININNIATAIINTFKSREVKIDISEMRKILKSLKESERTFDLWKQYQVDSNYSAKIECDELFKTLSTIINLLESELIKRQ